MLDKEILKHFIGMRLTYDKVLNDEEIDNIIKSYTLFYNLCVFEIWRGTHSTVIVLQPKRRV